MQQHTITLQGRQYTLAFNMATAIAYERLTGKSAFDLKQFTPDDTGAHMEAIFDLALCMLIANNGDDCINDKGAFLLSITTIEEMNAVISATADALNAFFRPQKGDITPSDGQPKEEGDAQKNACPPSTSTR